MTDLSASERRLITALERIDYIVERAAADMARPAAPASDDASRMAALHDENRRLSDEIAALRQVADAAAPAVDAGAHAARLAAANDALTTANRALIEAAADWAGRGEDAVRAALEAEVDSLRAARAAEQAQMADILDALDRLMAAPAETDAPPRAPAESAPSPHPRAARPADDMSLFGGVYDDEPDDVDDADPDDQMKERG